MIRTFQFLINSRVLLEVWSSNAMGHHSPVKRGPWSHNMHIQEAPGSYEILMYSGTSIEPVDCMPLIEEVALPGGL